MNFQTKYFKLIAVEFKYWQTHCLKPCDQLPNGMVECQGETDFKNNAQREKNQNMDRSITQKTFFKSPRKNKTIVLKLLDNENQHFSTQNTALHKM